MFHLTGVLHLCHQIGLGPVVPVIYISGTQIYPEKPTAGVCDVTWCTTYPTRNAKHRDINNSCGKPPRCHLFSDLGQKSGLVGMKLEINQVICISTHPRPGRFSKCFFLCDENRLGRL